MADELGNSQIERGRTSREQVQLRMGCEHPEPIMLSPERLHRRPLRQVPHANSLVLTTRHDKFVFRVEKRGRDVVEVPSTRIHLPCLRLAHPPNLDLPVVRGGDDEGKRRVERRPVDAAVVTLKHILDGREVIERVESAWRCVGGVLAQSRDIPHAYSLVLGRRDDEVILGMELGGHDIMGVASKDGDAVSGGAVPDANRLVVGA